MLEGLILTLVIGFALSYIAVKVAVWWVDWDCRRKNTPESRKLWVDGLADQGRTEFILALGHSPADTIEGRERQFREMDSPENRERWQKALKSRPRLSPEPERKESSHPCSAI